MSDCAIGRYIGINAPLHYSVYNLDISADDGAWTEKTRTPWTDKRSITRTSTSDVRPAVANSDRVVQTTSLQIVVVSLGIDSKSEKWVSVRVHVYGDDELAEGVVVSNTSSIDWPSRHFRLTTSLSMGASEWWVGRFWALRVVMNLDLCTVTNFARGILTYKLNSRVLRV